MLQISSVLRYRTNKTRFVSRLGRWRMLTSLKLHESGSNDDNNLQLQSRFISPIFLQTYRDSSQAFQKIQELSSFKSLTDSYLNDLSRKQSDGKPRITRNRVLEELEILVPPSLSNLTKSEDLQAVVSISGLLMPLSYTYWKSIDEHLSEQFFSFDQSLQYADIPQDLSLSPKDLYTSLLASYAIERAIKKIPVRFSYKFQLPSLVLNYFRRHKSFALTSPSFSNNQLIYLLTLQYDLFLHFQRENSPENKNEVRSNKIKLQPDPIVPNTLYRLEDLLFRHSKEVFSQLSSDNTTSEVRLVDLQPLWESLISLNFLNKDELYPILYRLTLSSIERDSSQLNGRDDLISSLLQSMITSKMKSTKLVDALCNHLLREGSTWNIGEYGLRLFGQLITLDDLPHAQKVLISVVKNASQSLNKLRKDNRSLLSVTGKAELFTALNASPLLQWAENSESLPLPQGQLLANELIMTLLCYHREEKGSAFAILFERIERAVSVALAQGAEMEVSDVISLLHCYAFVGRKPIPLIDQLFSRLLPKLPALGCAQLDQILYICAILNYCPTLSPNTSSDVIDEIFQLYSSNLTRKEGERSLFRVYWSLAVLRKLSISRFEQFHNSLYRFYREGEWGRKAKLQMLTQIYFELKLDVDESIGSKSSEVVEKERESLKQLEEFITREYKQQNNKHFSRSYDNSNEGSNEKEKNNKVRMLSSLMHDATSRILKLHNIDHMNEKSLLFNYIVDVFIPYKESLPWSSVLKKDVVLEIDGLFHFESFANVSSSHML